MIKRHSILFTIFFTVVLLLVIHSLFMHNKKLPWQIKESLINNIYANADILFLIDDNSLTDIGCCYCINNSSDNSIYFDEVYYIQIWSNKEWNSIVVDASFPAIDSCIPSKGVYKKDIVWEHLYGKLPAGKYRLLVPFRLNKDDLYSRYYLSTEFSI